MVARIQTSHEALLASYRDYLRADRKTPVTIEEYELEVRGALENPRGIIAHLQAIPSRPRWKRCKAALIHFARLTGDTKIPGAIFRLRAPPNTPPKPRVIPTIADWRGLAKRIEAERPPFSAVLWLVVYSGLRLGDVCRMQREWICDAAARGQTEIVQKGDRMRRWIVGPLSEPAVRWLAGYARTARHPWECLWECVTLSSGYRCSTYKGARQRIQRWIPEPYTPHSFRHAVASYLRYGIEPPTPIEVIMDVGGWQSMSALEQYLHRDMVAPARSEQAQGRLYEMLFGTGGNENARRETAL